MPGIDPPHAHSAPSGRWSDGLAVVLSAAIVVGVAGMVVSLAGRADRSVEAISPATMGVAVGGAAVAVIGVGTGLIATRRARDLTMLAFAAAGASFAELILLPVGLAVLIVAGLLWALLIRRASGRSRAAVAVGAGVVAAFAVVALLIIWIQRPLVECRDDGVATRSRPWWDSSGESSVVGRRLPSGGSVHTGTVETPRGRFVYRCEGTRLVTFEREPALSRR